MVTAENGEARDQERDPGHERQDQSDQAEDDEDQRGARPEQMAQTRRHEQTFRADEWKGLDLSAGRIIAGRDDRVDDRANPIRGRSTPLSSSPYRRGAARSTRQNAGVGAL